MTGKFQHRMEIQQLKTVDDGFGDGEPDKWETIRKEMFSLRPKQETSNQQSDQMQSQTTHDAKCHFFAGANSTMRLQYGDRTFNVESVVNEMERNRFLVWALTEVT